MSASSEEIARDIVVAAIANRTTVWNGQELAQLYSQVLKAVGEAARAESDAHRAHYAVR